MTKNSKQINSYRYQSKPGDQDYFDEYMELKKEFNGSIKRAMKNPCIKRNRNA